MSKIAVRNEVRLVLDQTTTLDDVQDFVAEAEDTLGSHCLVGAIGEGQGVYLVAVKRDAD